jgi:membrane protein involved in colicin uptake
MKKRPLAVLCLLVTACTSSAPTQEAAKADAAEQAKADAEQTLQNEVEKAKAEAIKAAQDAKQAEEIAAKKAEEAAKALLEAQQLAASNAKPVFVTLGGSGSRTAKPVSNALLAKSWGWGSASAAEIATCEASATSVGQQMWCSTQDKPKGAEKLIAKLKLAPGKSVFVTPEQIASWKVPAPTGSVWLFGPKQAC